ncbi:MAG: M81 family metallopeptidase [Pseudomonadota bacterium]
MNAQSGAPRIALAGLFEEVNTFATGSMGYAQITGNMATGFQKFEGQGLIAEYEGTQTHFGGYIAGLKDAGAEIIPTVHYQYSAGPTIAGDAYAKMKRDIVDSLAAAMPLDAVLLGMHGAGIAEGVDDVEGDLIAAIKDAIGNEVRIVSALDHHATLKPETAARFDYLTFVMNYPHIDWYQASFKAAVGAVGIVKGTFTPGQCWERLPFLLQCVSTDPGNAYAAIRLKLEEYGKRDGIHEMSLQYGFPWADVPHNTVAVNCWAETPELAQATAKEFAGWMWTNRANFVVPTLSAREALDAAANELVRQGRVSEEAVQDARALASRNGFDQSILGVGSVSKGDPATFGFVPDAGRKGPVVIAEKSDNPGCGATGDATHGLAELIRFGVKHACVTSIRDPETVAQAMAAGVGATIDVALGGKLSPVSGEPIRGQAYVKTISDGHFTVIGPMVTGLRLDVGPAVGLQIGGVDVVVVSGVMQSFDNGQMKMCGFDPMDYRVVVVKSAVHFRAYWIDVASFIVDSDPPGVATNDLGILDFQNKADGVYPLDANASYPA